MNRIKSFRIKLLVGVLIGLMTGFSSNAQSRKYSNAFLSIGVGARSMAMANATVASVNDVTAGYWNPGGLTQMETDYSVGLMHSEYFAGIAKYDYAALGLKLDDRSALALSYIRFGVDDIPNTTELIDNDGNVNYDRITSFSAIDNAFLISYARNTNIEGLAVGGSAKIIYRKIGDFAQSWGFGIDVGARYEKKNWRFGALLRDATSTFNSWSYSLSDRMKEVFEQTNNELPQNGLELTLPRLILGVGREFTIQEKFHVLPELNFDLTFDGQRSTLIQGDPMSIDPYFGLEVSYDNLVYLRGGVGNFQRTKAEVGDHKVTTFQPSAGIGLSLKGVTIDYALTDIGDQSAALYSNVFSLKIDLNKPEK